MITVSNDFKTAIASSGRTLACKLIGGTVTLTESEIANIKFESYSSTDEFLIGTASMSLVEIEIINTNGTITEVFENKEYEIQIGVQLPNLSYEYVSLGLFTIYESTKERGIIKISGMDRMYKLDVEYTSNITYPATISQIFTDICNTVGLQYVSNVFVNSNLVLNEPPSFYRATFRDVLKYISELAGGIGIITRDGKLQIKTFSTTTSQTITTDNYITFKYSEVKPNIIDKLVIVQGSLETEFGVGTNKYYIVDNPLIVDASVVGTNILNIISQINFQPCDLFWVGNPALELGDKVVVNDDIATHNVLIQNQKFTFNGGLRSNIICEAKSESEKESSGLTPLSIIVNEFKTQVIQNQNEISLKADKTQVDTIETALSGLSEVVSENTALISINAEQILNRVTNTTFSEVTSEFTEQITDLVQTSNDLTLSISNTNKIVSGDPAVPTDTGLVGVGENIKTNFKFDANGMEIGKSDSEYKMSLSNDSLQFKQGANVVSEINTGTMTITHAVMSESSTVGKHKIEKLSGDFTIVRFVG